VVEVNRLHVKDAASSAASRLGGTDRSRDEAYSYRADALAIAASFTVVFKRGFLSVASVERSDTVDHSFVVTVEVDQCASPPRLPKLHTRVRFPSPAPSIFHNISNVLDGDLARRGTFKRLVLYNVSTTFELSVSRCSAGGARAIVSGGRLNAKPPGKLDVYSTFLVRSWPAVTLERLGRRQLTFGKPFRERRVRWYTVIGFDLKDELDTTVPTSPPNLFSI